MMLWANWFRKLDKGADINGSMCTRIIIGIDRTVGTVTYI